MVLSILGRASEFSGTQAPVVFPANPFSDSHRTYLHLKSFPQKQTHGTLEPGFTTQSNKGAFMDRLSKPTDDRP
jgi:hypothetical protein